MPTVRSKRLDFKVCLYAAPLLLAACANQPEAVEEIAEAQRAEPETAPIRAEATSDRVSQADTLLSQLVIHFDFDSSEVAPDYRQLLVAHGRYLADNSGISLRLEGHADERGTREYNVGLGARRATSVRQLLLLQGARDEQIEILSYGEEKPAVAGSGERSWRENRRVEFNYLSDG